MIEAVNATVSNAQLLRSVAEQTSSTQVLSANPSRVQAAAIVAPYLSPHVDLNGGQSKPIFVVRDAATGEHVKQFPTEAQIRAYQRAQEVRSEAMTVQHAESQFLQQQKSADIAKSSVEFRQVRQEIKQYQEATLPGQKAATKTADAPKSYGGSSSSQSSQTLTVDTEV
ncbi:MAG: hypothetical protein WC043_04950 [Pseudobdellovibrionaceae bacterium]